MERIKQIGVLVFRLGVSVILLVLLFRFNKIDLETITVLKIWEYIDGNEAYIQEQKILKEFNRFRYKGSNILSSGNSEIFTHDVLGIDLPSI